MVAINPDLINLPRGSNLILNNMKPAIKMMKGRHSEDIPNHLLMNKLENHAPNLPPQFSTVTSGPEKTADQLKL